MTEKEVEAIYLQHKIRLQTDPLYALVGAALEEHLRAAAAAAAAEMRKARMQ